MWKEKFIQYIRYEKNYSSLTDISYFKDITQFENFVIAQNGTFNPPDVNAAHIRIWITELMEQGFKPRSINRKLSAVKSFFKYLKKQGVIRQNPAESISGPKADKRLPSFAPDNDLNKIIDAPQEYPDGFAGERDRFLIELLYVTGMRRAELIALKDTDIDFNNCTLRVTGKRNKQRLIPFSDDTRQKLEKYIKTRDAEIENKSPFLFVKEDGAPLYPKLVYNITHKHLSGISTLAKKSPHVLRHSFATEMLNNGAEINAVKELLGHASLASTEVYTHVTFKELKRVYHKAHPRAN